MSETSETSLLLPGKFFASDCLVRWPDTYPVYNYSAALRVEPDLCVLISFGFDPDADPRGAIVLGSASLLSLQNTFEEISETNLRFKKAYETYEARIKISPEYDECDPPTLNTDLD